VRQRAVWRFVVLSLATRRKGDNDIGCVVAIINATRSGPNQPTYKSVHAKFCNFNLNVKLILVYSTKKGEYQT
jgi:hypothetical protein